MPALACCMSQSKDLNPDEPLAALKRVLQTLREASDTPIESVLAYLKTQFAYDLVWLGVYDRIEHRFIGKGGKSPLGDTALKQRLAIAAGDVLEQVVIQQVPVTIPDLREEQRAQFWRKLAQSANIQGTIALPISFKDRCYGAVLLGSRLWANFPKPEERVILTIVLGELASVIDRAETERQRQQVKQIDRPMLDLLSQLRFAPQSASESLPNLTHRFEAIVEQTQQFVQPTRTSIYWFDRQERCFWRKVTHQKSINRIEPATSTLSVQELNGFYQALVSDQLVSIGESMGSLKADLGGRLIKLIRARSLLAAPILYQTELLGFLMCEGSEPRLWKDEEKNFVRAAAQLAALVSPLETMDSTIEQTKRDQALTSEVARAVYSTQDWQSTLKQAADLIYRRLNVDRFIVLLFDDDRQVFQVCYQTQPKNRRALLSALGTLSPIDRQMLQRQLCAIESFEGDLRLAAWRSPMLESGVRSLIACNTALGQPAAGVLVLAHHAPRVWSHAETELIQSVAQQIGVVLRQWQLQAITEQQQKIEQTIQWGLSTIVQSQQLDLLEKSALQYIAQMLQAPLAVLVAWSPGRRIGRITQASDGDPRFSCNAATKVSIETDSLMQRALTHDGRLTLSIDDVSIETRQWLNAPAIGQLLVMVLRTAPEHEPTGILIVADDLERHWIDRHLVAVTTLVTQFAWSRRYLMLSEMLKRDRDRLERLSWYKHRRLEDVFRTVKTGVTRLTEIAPDGRQPQILQQISDAIEPIRQVVRDEQWQLTVRTETVPMLSIVRRSLDRVEPLIKQRQLWSQVHHETNPMIRGDVTKIELVLYELLLIAGSRSQPGGRIDLWCRPLDSHWIEIAITDDGTIEPRLIEDLEAGRAVDLLAPTMLDKPPGLHLAICQSLMQQMGCEFNLYKLSDGRIMSRIVLPIG